MTFSMSITFILIYLIIVLSFSSFIDVRKYIDENKISNTNKG